MKVKYDFVTGETVVVDASESIGEMAVALDKEIANNDRRETRRHTSLDSMENEGKFFADKTDLLEDVLQNETVAKVREAVSKLKPQQRELIYALYLSPRPLSQSEYAEQLGISELSVKQKAWRARMRLREIIDQEKYF